VSVIKTPATADRSFSKPQVIQFRPVEVVGEALYRLSKLQASAPLLPPFGFLFYQYVRTLTLKPQAYYQKMYSNLPLEFILIVAQITTATSVNTCCKDYSVGYTSWMDSLAVTSAAVSPSPPNTWLKLVTSTSRGLEPSA